MSVPLVSSFRDLILSFAPVFSQPSYQNFLTLIAGWVFCFGRHTVTNLIVAAGAVGKKHFTCFHRFFSRATWRLESVGHVILKLTLRFVPDGESVLLAVDDTLGRKTGRHIWAAGMHHDPLRSTATRPAFSFGHSWVVLSIIVPLPYIKHRRIAIPFLFKLYRKKVKKRKPGRPKGERKSTGAAGAKEYRTRPQLAVEMLEIVAEWLEGRGFRVVGDSEYSGKSISRHLPLTADLVGRMPMDAALYAEPEPRKPQQRGRTRKKGARLPNPTQFASSRSVKWTKTRVDIYGKSVRVWFKSMRALWYNSAGEQPVKVVVVRDPSGNRRDDCFFTTDLSMTESQVIETIGRRWSLEVAFRDTKQYLGFEEPQSWTRKAVERTAPMAFMLYSMTVLWYAEHGEALRDGWFVTRPWYRKKRSASFADILATLRQASWAEPNFVDPAKQVGSTKKDRDCVVQLQDWLSAAG